MSSHVIVGIENPPLTPSAMILTMLSLLSNVLFIEHAV